MLAYRLNDVFKHLTTDEDRIRHNIVVDEMLDIINTGQAGQGEITREEKQLFDYIADILLRKRAKKRNFLRRVATKAFDIALMKG